MNIHRLQRARLQQRTFRRAYNFCAGRDLKPGAPLRIQTTAEQPDGTYTATSMSVGKDGTRPI
jgi:hypothetical protein